MSNQAKRFRLYGAGHHVANEQMEELVNYVKALQEKRLGGSHTKDAPFRSRQIVRKTSCRWAGEVWECGGDNSLKDNSCAESIDVLRGQGCQLFAVPAQTAEA